MTMRDTMERMPLVSIVIPTRNRASWMRDAAASVLRQSYQPLELIVVDDGSTDNTPAVAAELGPRARYLRTPGRGVAAARNVGLLAARGELIGFLDDDDVFLPGKIESQVALLVADPKAVLAHCRYHYMRIDGVIMHHSGVLPYGAVDRLLVPNNFIWSGAPLIRRAHLNAVGGFDERLSAAADFDLWLRLAQRGRFACVQELLGAYRIVPGSMATRTDVMESDCMLALSKHFARQDVDVSSRERGEAEARWRLWLACGYVNQGDMAEARRNLARAHACAPHLFGTRAGIVDTLSKLSLDARHDNPVAFVQTLFSAIQHAVPHICRHQSAVLTRAAIAAAMREFAAGRLDAGHQQLTALLNAPATSGVDASLIEKMLFESAMSAWIGPDEFVQLVNGSWPMRTRALSSICGHVIADIRVWQGVELFMLGQTSTALRPLIYGLVRRPVWLRNSGVRSVLARSVLAAVRSVNLKDKRSVPLATAKPAASGAGYR